tara:strand:+ start:849 stop:1757 length:909 start_codon:yes stop_codon:yes gene_type:complete
MTNNHGESQYYPIGDIDIRELISILWKGKFIITSFIILTSIIGLIVAFQLPNFYKSEALLAPAQPSSGLNRTMQNYSGLASLAGLDLPSGPEINQTAEAIEKIKSLSFFEKQIIPDIFLPDLMAIDSWNRVLNLMEYDPSMFNKTEQKWIKKPTVQESFDEFKELLSISEDPNTGFIRLAIEHHSPFIAKSWVDLIISKINSSLRLEKKRIAEKSIEYLEYQMSQTNLTEIKQVLAELVQSQIQQLAVIETNEAYVFRYIDPPVASENKIKPDRLMILFLSSLLGAIFGALLVLINFFRDKS